MNADEVIDILRRCCVTTTHCTDAMNRKGSRGFKTASAHEDAAYKAAFRKIVGRKPTEEEIQRMTHT